MRRPDLRGQRCRPKPIQHLRYHSDRAGNRPCARFQTAAHRVFAFRAAGVLRCIRVRNCGGLAIRRHQGGDSRECDYRSLQPNSEHYDEGNELTLHKGIVALDPHSRSPNGASFVMRFKVLARGLEPKQRTGFKI